MDFFEHQERARRKTRVLIFYFMLAVAFIIAALYSVLVLLGGNYDSPAGWWNPEMLGAVALGVLLLVSAGTGFKTLQLRAGGRVVAEALDGRPISPNTTDFHERKLLNVVEEMALASGTPVPEVYVLDREDGINAFAAGKTPADAVIGVTRGCIRQLSREELQGVIAHEFSHILNGDMRLSTRLIGLLFGILLISILGRILVRSLASGRGSSRSGKKEGGAGAIILFGFALLVIGYIGVFFGKLIKAAVSRQREFLADAAAVQFTRNPGGIAGALKRIGAPGEGSKIATAHAEEASHMFFANGLGKSLASAFATHPPLPARIRAIEPAWDGTFPRPRAEAIEPEPASAQKGAPPLDALRRHIPALGVILAQSVASEPQLAAAHATIEKLPRELTEALHDPAGASALVYALLLSRDDALRQRQLADLQPRIPDAVSSALARLALPAPENGSPLVLVSLAIPALREIGPEGYRTFAENLDRLVHADGKVTLFEFALLKLVKRHLAVHFGIIRPARVRHTRIEPLLGDAAVLLSAIAHLSSAQPAEAFRSGASQLGAGRADLAFLPPEQCGLPQADAALDRLAEAAPLIKKRLLLACAKTAMADDQVSAREFDLLRAIADDLDCPIPPLTATPHSPPPSGGAQSFR